MRRGSPAAPSLRFVFRGVGFVGLTVFLFPRRESSHFRALGMKDAAPRFWTNSSRYSSKVCNIKVDNRSEPRPRVLDLFGGHIRIPVANALVLLADVGFDVSLICRAAILLSDALLASGSHSSGETGRWPQNCEIVPSTAIRPVTGTFPFRSACRFR